MRAKALAIPAIASTALARTGAEMLLIPAMSTTLYIIVMSEEPTYGRDVARRHGRDHQFRYAQRQGAHRPGGDGGAAAAADGEHPVQPALGVQA